MNVENKNSCTRLRASPCRSGPYDNIQSPSPFTFNGAKGMGEGGGGPLHTIAAALQDALWASGAVVSDSHYSPSDLFEALVGEVAQSKVKIHDH